MKPVSALNGVGEPHRRFLVVDPGTRTGLCLYEPPTRGVDPRYTTWACGIDDLPGQLHIYAHTVAFIVCEDFRLAGGNYRNAGATDMPASRGIGMCQMACWAADIELFMAQRNAKRAGAEALDTHGRLARSRAKNEHERDAVDLLGYALRQMRLPS